MVMDPRSWLRCRTKQEKNDRERDEGMLANLSAGRHGIIQTGAETGVIEKLLLQTGNKR